MTCAELTVGTFPDGDDPGEGGSTEQTDTILALVLFAVIAYLIIGK